MSESRDGWSKLDIALKAVAGVALPLVVFVVGQQVTSQQQKSAAADRRIERLNSMIAPLASENSRERRIAIEVAGYLAKVKELPLELVPVLTNLAQSDPSSVTAQAASDALAQVEQANPALRPRIEATFNEIPARIYFHIDADSQRDRARSIASRLTEELGAGFVVPGIEKRPGPTRSELRFFKSGEAGEAGRIAAGLAELGVDVKLADFSGRYESSTQIRPRHFELWLGDDFPPEP